MFGNMELPVTGGVVLAGLAYCTVSLFMTGPLVGERLVAKMDWPKQCAAHIRAEAEAEQSASKPMPKLGCHEMIGGWFGNEGAAFCASHGAILDKSPISQSLQAADDAKREAQGKLLEFAAGRAASRCECAVTTTLENRRVAFAIHAGSARLVTPSSVKLLAGDLVSVLNSSACAMKG